MLEASSQIFTYKKMVLTPLILMEIWQSIPDCAGLLIFILIIIILHIIFVINLHLCQ